MSKPIAVVISDAHYTLKSLDMADTAFRMAVDTAADLNVPLIDGGDLTNDKPLLRAEVVSRIINTGHYAADKKVQILSIVGNHSLINERSTEENALTFLQACENWDVITCPLNYRGFNFIPYQPSRDLFVQALGKFSKNSLIIAHQGLTKAWPGEYCHDHSAIYPDDVADYRVISGHYHRAQDIKTGRPRKGAVGLWSYIGSPYTTSFAEANDGPKGFQILYDNGLLELVPTNLRKHVIIELEWNATAGYSGGWPVEHVSCGVLPNDLVWVKVKGPSAALSLIDKVKFGACLDCPDNYRLDKISIDSPSPVIQNIEKKSGVEVLDELIESSDESAPRKEELKKLTRELTS